MTRDLALAVLLVLLSSVLSRGNFTRGDASTFTFWTAGAFFLGAIVAWIAAQGYLASKVLGPMQADRRLPILLVSLAYFPMFYFADRIVPDSWAIALLGVLLLACFVVAIRRFDVTVFLEYTIREVMASRPASRPLQVVTVLAAFALFSFASFFGSAIPRNEVAKGGSLWGLVAVEFVVVTAILLQFYKVRLYVLAQRKNFRMAGATLAALGLLVTTLVFYYWGKDVADRQQSGDDQASSLYLGLQKSWACLDSTGSEVPNDSGPFLVLVADGSNYLLWQGDRGTRRVPGRTTSLVYVDSADATCS